MATQGGRKATKGKAGIPTSDYPIPPIYVVAPRALEQDWGIVMGWVAACVLVVLLLPLIGMLYLDVLQTKKEAQQQIEKMEKLRREVEKEKRNDSNSRITPR